MSEFDAILDESDANAAALALESLLMRPVREVRASEARSPEQDLIATARRRGLVGARGNALAGVAAALLEKVERSIARGDLSESTLGVAGRLGFLCTSLELDVDASHLYKIALTLGLMMDAGTAVPLTEYFLVLRSIGRLRRSGASTLGLEVFWSSKLDHEAFEIRTLAAQNLVRVSAPWRLRTYYAASLFQTDVDHQLVAFEWLLRAGSPAALVEEAGELSPDALEVLARGLDDVGEDRAALAIRMLLTGRHGASLAPAVPDWLGELPSGSPVPAHAIAEFPRVASPVPLGAAITGRLRSAAGSGPDLEALRSFMGDVGSGGRTGTRPPSPVDVDARRAAMADR